MIDSQLFTSRDDDSIHHLAKAWIELQRAPHNSDEYNALFWAYEKLSGLVDDQPDAAWQVVLLIWSIDQSIPTEQNLSAGPVEYLLAKHGDRMIALVEAAAKRDPSFAKMLGGVWKNQMSDEVWARLQCVWDRRGWDGIPE